MNEKSLICQQNIPRKKRRWIWTHQWAKGRRQWQPGDLHRDTHVRHTFFFSGNGTETVQQRNANRGAQLTDNLYY